MPARYLLCGGDDRRVTGTLATLTPTMGDMDPATLAAIAALANGEIYEGGGGAAPAWSIERIGDTAPRVWVRSMLDLSTAHLPARFFAASGAAGLTGAAPTDHGMILWVADDPARSAATGGLADDDDPDVLRVTTFARSLGCDFIVFDSDGEIIDDLPHWEW